MEKTGSRRYFVLAAGMLIQLCAGIIYMWSVFKQPVAEWLAWDAGQAAVTSSIMLAAFVIGILVGGWIQDRTNPKWVVIGGSILMSAGMMLSCLVTSNAPGMIYFTYGILGGLGVGTVYTTTVSVIQKWFPDKRGFATGMTVCAFGFSLVIFTPAANAMIANMGVAMTFLTFGCIFLVVCIASALLIKNPQTEAGSKAVIGGKKQYTTKEMLKTKQFYLIAFSMLFLLPAYFILNPIFITLGMDRGLSEALASAGVMITGIASAGGRLLASWISDKIGRKATLAAIMILTLAAVIGMIFARDLFFIVCIAVIAFGFGGSSGVYAALTADHFGTKNMGANFGCVMVAFGVSALVFQTLSSILSKGGDYTASFVIAGVTCVIALVLILLLKKPKEAD